MNQKRDTWIKDRYFYPDGQRKWIFAAQTKDKDGKPRVMKLALASDTKIVRHLKIKGKANPFGSPVKSSDVSRYDRQGSVIVMNKVPNSPDVIFYSF